MDPLQSIAQLGEALSDRAKSLTSVRRVLARCLVDLAAWSRAAPRSQVTAAQEPVEATLRTLLASPAPLFPDPIIQLLAETYVALFQQGDIRRVNGAVEFLCKQLSTSPKSGEGAGAASARLACAIVLGELCGAFGVRDASELERIAQLLMKLSKDGEVSIRAAAATSLYLALDGSKALTTTPATGKLFQAIVKHVADSLMTDEAPTVRLAAAHVLAAVARRSQDFALVSLEECLRLVARLLCDAHIGPRMAAAAALSELLRLSVTGKLSRGSGGVDKEKPGDGSSGGPEDGEGEGEEEEDGGDVDEPEDFDRSGVDEDVDHGGSAAADSGGAAAAEDSSGGKSSKPPSGSLMQRMKAFGKTMTKAAGGGGKSSGSAIGASDSGAAVVPETDAAREATKAAAAAVAASVAQDKTGLARTLGMVNYASRKKKKATGPLRFTIVSALSYLANLLRASGQLARKYSGRIGDVRIAIAVAGAAFLRTVRNTPGILSDTDVQPAITAICGALSVGTSDPVKANAAAPYLSLADSAARSGGPAYMMVACVKHIIIFGLCEPPGAVDSFSRGKWQQWQRFLLQTVLDLLAAECGGSSDSALAAESRGSKAEAGSDGRGAGAASHKGGIASLTSFRWNKGDKPASANTPVETRLCSPLAFTCLLDLCTYLLPRAHMWGTPTARGVAIAAASAATHCVSHAAHAVRLAAVELCRVACRMLPSLLDGVLARSLKACEQLHGELTSPAARAASSAAAAAGALADAVMFTQMRRSAVGSSAFGKRAAAASNRAGNIMTHMGISAATSSPGGSGVPGAGAGSGLSVCLGEDAVHLAALHGASLLAAMCVATALQLEALTPSQAGAHSCAHISQARLEDCLRVCLLLLRAGRDTRHQRSSASAMALHGQGAGSSSSASSNAAATASLAQSAAAAATAEVDAACSRAGWALFVGVCSAPSEWLLSSRIWPALFTPLAEHILRSLEEADVAGLSSPKEGAGAFLLSPLGVPHVVASATVLLKSSFSSSGAGGGRGDGDDAPLPTSSLLPTTAPDAADAVGLAIARSVYAGVPAAWRWTAFAAACSGLRALGTAAATYAAQSPLAAESLQRLLRAAFVVVNQNRIIPAQVAAYIMKGQHAAANPAFYAAAEALSTRVPSAAVITHGASAAGGVGGVDALGHTATAQDMAHVNVRGVPYSIDDAHLYSPNGVSLAAIAVARRAVMHSVACLLHASTQLPLHLVQLLPMRGPILCVAISVLSGGALTLDPMALGLVSMDAPPRAADAVAQAVTGDDPISAAASQARATEMKISAALSTVPVDEPTWSALVLSMCHRPVPAVAAHLTCTEHAVSHTLVEGYAELPQQYGAVRLPASLHSALQPTAAAVELDLAAALRWPPPLAPAALATPAADAATTASHPLDALLQLSGQPSNTDMPTEAPMHTTADETAVHSSIASLAALVPRLPLGQAEAVITALALLLRVGASDAADEVAAHPAFRFVPAALTAADKLQVARNAAACLLQLLRCSAVEDVMGTAADSDDAAEPVPWLLSVRAALGSGVNHTDPVTRRACGDGLGEVAQLCGQSMGKRLQAALTKQLAKAAELNSGPSTAQALNVIAGCSYALARVIAASPAALEVEPGVESALFDAARDLRQPVRTWALAAWAQLLMRAARHSQAGGQPQRLIAPTVALLEAHALAAPSPMECSRAGEPVTAKTVAGRAVLTSGASAQFDGLDVAPILGVSSPALTAADTPYPAGGALVSCDRLGGLLAASDVAEPGGISDDSARPLPPMALFLAFDAATGEVVPAPGQASADGSAESDDASADTSNAAPYRTLARAFVSLGGMVACRCTAGAVYSGLESGGVVSVHRAAATTAATNPLDASVAALVAQMTSSLVSAIQAVTDAPAAASAKEGVLSAWVQLASCRDARVVSQLATTAASLQSDSSIVQQTAVRVLRTAQVLGRHSAGHVAVEFVSADGDPVSPSAEDSKWLLAMARMGIFDSSKRHALVYSRLMHSDLVSQGCAPHAIEMLTKDSTSTQASKLSRAQARPDEPASAVELVSMSRLSVSSWPLWLPRAVSDLLPPEQMLRLAEELVSLTAPALASSNQQLRTVQPISLPADVLFALKRAFDLRDPLVEHLQPALLQQPFTAVSTSDASTFVELLCSALSQWNEQEEPASIADSAAPVAGASLLACLRALTTVCQSFEGVADPLVPSLPFLRQFEAILLPCSSNFLRPVWAGSEAFSLACTLAACFLSANTIEADTFSRRLLRPMLALLPLTQTGAFALGALAPSSAASLLRTTAAAMSAAASSSSSAILATLAPSLPSLLTLWAASASDRGLMQACAAAFTVAPPDAALAATWQQQVQAADKLALRHIGVTVFEAVACAALARNDTTVGTQLLRSPNMATAPRAVVVALHSRFGAHAASGTTVLPPAAGMLDALFARAILRLIHQLQEGHGGIAASALHGARAAVSTAHPALGAALSAALAELQLTSAHGAVPLDSVDTTSAYLAAASSSTTAAPHVWHQLLSAHPSADVGAAWLSAVAGTHPHATAITAMTSALKAVPAWWPVAAVGILVMLHRFSVAAPAANNAEGAAVVKAVAELLAACGSQDPRGELPADASFVACTLPLAVPLLYPGYHSAAVNTEWVPTDAQAAMGTAMMTVVRANAAGFKAWLSSLAAEDKVQLETALRAASAGTRKPRPASAPPAVSATSGGLKLDFKKFAATATAPAPKPAAAPALDLAALMAVDLGKRIRSESEEEEDNDTDNEDVQHNPAAESGQEGDGAAAAAE